MPVRSHHTRSSIRRQSPPTAPDSWISEVVPRLPSDLDQQARQLQAFQRARAFACPADLLRGLLLYALSPFGFRFLGAWGVLTDVADLSAAGWHDALIRSSAFLLWLIGELLVANDRPVFITQRIRGRVWLVDASMLGQPGQSGDAWRLHMAFDLIAGQIGQVHLSDRHTGERLAHFQLQPGDLVLLDAGYGYRATLATAQAVGAAVLVPFTPSTCPLQDGWGRALDLLAWLRQEGSPIRQRTAWWTSAGQRGQVRLVAKRRAEHQRQAAERKLRRKAHQHGRAVSTSALFLCGWLLLLTTLDATAWAATEVLWLYRARWQVELLFKRMKQLLRLGRVRATSAAGATASIRALLVAWLLQEQVSTALRGLLPCLSAPVAMGGEAETRAVVSTWTVTVMSLETLRQQVVGTWTDVRVRACLPRLRRFLVSRSRRPHQETEVRAFLTGWPNSGSRFSDVPHDGRIDW
ncbi:MAG TPA: transposase [Roseiflexaceae bacterium]|nr:transposase [Roseiflexaceae bacterium]